MAWSDPSSEQLLRDAIADVIKHYVIMPQNRDELILPGVNVESFIDDIVDLVENW